MTPLISVGQMPAVTAAAHRTPLPVRPLQAKAAATLNSLPSAATLLAVGPTVVPGSRWAPLGGERPALLRHHSRRSFPLSAAQPSPSTCGGVRAGLRTPARCTLGGGR